MRKCFCVWILLIAFFAEGAESGEEPKGSEREFSLFLNSKTKVPEAVKQFNSRYREILSERAQPLLTDDEIMAALSTGYSWYVLPMQSHFNKVCLKAYRSRTVPKGASISVVFEQRMGAQVQKFTFIKLTLRNSTDKHPKGGPQEEAEGENDSLDLPVRFVAGPVEKSGEPAPSADKGR
jgi:hypothetical protein